jgi:hypothetical protein
MVCQLQSEQGEVLEQVVDHGGFIAASVPPLTNEGSRCWRFIDPYGDTVFNCLQMEPFLVELDVIIRQAPADRLQLLERIRALALRCRDDVHLYLKFEGD